MNSLASVIASERSERSNLLKRLPRRLRLLAMTLENIWALRKTAAWYGADRSHNHNERDKDLKTIKISLLKKSVYQTP